MTTAQRTESGYEVGPMRALLFVDDAAWCSDFNHARRPDDFTYDLAGSEDEVKRLLEAKAFDVIITRRGPRELAFTRFQRLLAKVAPACPLYLLEEGDVEGATCVGALTPQGLVDLLASEFELAPRTSPLDGYEVTRLLTDRGSWYLHAARSLASGEHGVLSTFDFSFEDEVDALTDVLAHPPAANVVELDADHPRIFWALGEGRTVRELGVVSTEVALAVLEQLTASLAALHGAEQVHGWFNPDCLWVNRDGEVQLINRHVAGIAERVRESTRGSLRRVIDERWAVPEQFTTPRTPEADVFRVGLVAFALLEGRSPFDGRDAFEAAKQLKEGPVPPVRERTLAPLLEAMLTKDPDARPTAAALHAEVLKLAPKPGLVARALGKRWDSTAVLRGLS